jgi:hypothetical protein
VILEREPRGRRHPCLHGFRDACRLGWLRSQAILLRAPAGTRLAKA